MEDCWPNHGCTINASSLTHIKDECKQPLKEPLIDHDVNVEQTKSNDTPLGFSGIPQWTVDSKCFPINGFKDLIDNPVEFDLES